MLRPAPMELFSAVVLDKDLDQFTGMLLTLGVLHLVNIKELQSFSEGLEASKTPEKLSRYQEAQKRTVELLKKLDRRFTDSQLVAGPQEWNIEKIFKTLEEIEGVVNPKLKEKERLQIELEVKRSVHERLQLLPGEHISRASHGQFSYLEIVFGKAVTESFTLIEEGLKDIVHVLLPLKTIGLETVGLAIALKKDHALLETILDKAGFERLDLPREADLGLEKAENEIKNSQRTLQESIHELDAAIALETSRVAPVLKNLHHQLTAWTDIFGAQEYFQKTARTFLVSGWLPIKEHNKVVRNIHSLIGTRCFIHEQKPKDIAAIAQKCRKVPVLLNNPGIIRPFEFLVTTFNIPEYDSVDPTLFVAVSYLIMFGAMFGDAGQGLVLMITGLVLFWRCHNTASQIGLLIAYCGGAAILFGFLYGNFFGMEGVLKPLWVKPFSNVPSFLLVSVVLGAIMISAGILINIVNAFRSGDIVRGILDKSGLMGGMIYWIGIALASRYLFFKTGSYDMRFLFFLLGALVLVFIFKAPIEDLLYRRKGHSHQDGLIQAIETFVEVAESLTKYLVNTLSFIRVSAFALAHTGLFLAVFSLADMVKHSMGAAGSMAVVILGNIFIIFFEGMIVAIQAIRLEYYEFFSRFFEGSGELYRPVKFNRSI